MDCEVSTFRLSISKSCENFSKFSYIQPDNLEIKSLSRQGAFRKRSIIGDTFMEKKKTIFNDAKEIIKNESLPYENNSITLLKEYETRRRKHSTGSFTIKEMFRSLKKENKDDAKRKMSTNILRNLSKTDDQEIQVFLDSQATEISEPIFQPVIILEPMWQEFQENDEVIDKRQLEHHAAIWEIIQTEVDFLRKLDIAVRIFYPLLDKLKVQYDGEVPDFKLEEVFGNLKDLYWDHCTFWKQCISLPLMSKDAKRDILDISLMKEGFCKISTILQNYIQFMQILPSMRKTITRLQKESIIFNKYLEWTEKYDRMSHSGCTCVLNTCFQRIMRYKILLERVKSHCSEEKRDDLNIMISCVHEFLGQINSSMVGEYTMKDIKEKLVLDNVTKNLCLEVTKIANDENMSFDIMRPLPGFQERVLIHQGRLRLKECYNKTVEVQCYLCNDLFMICKPFKSNWDKLKIHKSPIRLDKLQVKEEPADGCLIVIVYNDFKVMEGIYVLIGDGIEIKLWAEKCTKTISSFVSQFKESVAQCLLEVNDSFDKVLLPKEDCCSFECHPRSETLSSVKSLDSTMSMMCDSFTQTYDIDLSLSDLTSQTTHSESERSSSLENVSMINESLFVHFCARPQISLSGNSCAGEFFI